MPVHVLQPTFYTCIDIFVSHCKEAKALPGIGERLADKIWEIVESGELRKLKELTSEEDTIAINLFTNIWGVGASTARLWVQQGLRSLDDVKVSKLQKKNLSNHNGAPILMPK